MGVIFAKSLQNMPFLESINLTDNNLTDTSLHHIIDAFQSIPALTCLNLSNNEINRTAATSLASYVANNATLTTLLLSKADLDDYECQLFVVAAAENVTLTKLDLSNNDIGKSEISPVLKRRNGSGAEALAALLSSGESRLQHLNLKWNQIRFQGAYDLVNSLKLNKTLLHLNLAYNSLGNRAAEMLGSALLWNNTLISLNLENNNIQGSGCFTLCIGILENTSLTSVCLDTNPLTEFGVVMLMQLPLDVGHRVKISANNCSFARVVEKDAMFEHANPTGEYELLLHEPFQRAIAIRLLHLVATTPQYKVSKLQYQMPLKPRTKAIKKNRNITLVGAISREKVQYLNEVCRTTLHNLQKVQAAAGDLKKARSLFQQYDCNGDGTLDAQEMQKVLADINLPSDAAAVAAAMKVYDIDGAGTIELGEFCYYLNAQAQEARDQIRGLTECKILATRNRPDIKYVPPTTGKLFITIARDYANTQPGQAMTKAALDDCMAMINEGNVGVKSQLLEHSIQHVILRKNEAVYLFHVMREEISDPSEVMLMIMPRIGEAKEVAEVLCQCLPDINSQDRLRHVMGICLNPLLVSMNYIVCFYFLWI